MTLGLADDLRVEYAARSRDEIRDLRRELKDMQSITEVVVDPPATSIS